MYQQETPEHFLQISQHFKLGCLLTEQSSPITHNLSQLSINDLPTAIGKINQLDIHTLCVLQGLIPKLQKLYMDINQCLQNGGRIFMCGCGATGRLSLVLETIFRQQAQLIYAQWINKTVGFMAGGDAALIKSIEDFQDHPEFAEQQLLQLGFTNNDMLIGSTEGGQTPWVIAAVWKSIQITNRKPYILYGNTDQILINHVQRSKQFILSEKINKINCNVGQMALAGSTRMQATTILMHAIGICLLGCDRFRSNIYPGLQWLQYAQNNIKTLKQYIKNVDVVKLAPLIEYESNLYHKGQNVTYCCDEYYAISILTDTTERSPTFSLRPFPNDHDEEDPEKCWCTLEIKDKKNKNGAQNTSNLDYWKILLANRQVRCLNTPYWSKYHNKVTTKAIQGFNLHINRNNKIVVSHPLQFSAVKGQQEILKIHFTAYPINCRLSHQSVLKMFINNVSTLIMGRMGRYQNNIMTYVKPTNYKLIDRATRYVMQLRPNSSYPQVVRAIFYIRDSLQFEEPIVLKVIEYLNEEQKLKSIQNNN